MPKYRIHSDPVFFCETQTVKSLMLLWKLPPRHASVNLVYDRKPRRYAEDNRTTQWYT